MKNLPIWIIVVGLLVALLGSLSREGTKEHSPTLEELRIKFDEMRKRQDSRDMLERAFKLTSEFAKQVSDPPTQYGWVSYEEMSNLMRSSDQRIIKRGMPFSECKEKMETITASVDRDSYIVISDKKNVKSMGFNLSEDGFLDGGLLMSCNGKDDVPWVMLVRSIKDRPFNTFLPPDLIFKMGWFSPEEIKDLINSKRVKSIEKFMDFGNCLQVIDVLSYIMGEESSIITDMDRFKGAAWRIPAGGSLVVHCMESYKLHYDEETGNSYYGEISIAKTLREDLF